MLVFTRTVALCARPCWASEYTILCITEATEEGKRRRKKIRNSQQPDDGNQLVVLRQMTFKRPVMRKGGYQLFIGSDAKINKDRRCYKLLKLF